MARGKRDSTVVEVTQAATKQAKEKTTKKPVAEKKQKSNDGATGSAVVGGGQRKRKPLPPSPSVKAVATTAAASGTSPVPPKRRRDTATPVRETYAARSDGLEDACAGTLVTWGNGEMGQLGLGPDVTEKRRPARVQAGTKYTHVASCTIHTVAVEATSSPDAPCPVVVSMGCNDEGALGRHTEDEEECQEPRPVDMSRMPSTFKVAKVCGGDSHSALLTTDGRVFVWGVYRVRFLFLCSCYCS